MHTSIRSPFPDNTEVELGTLSQAERTFRFNGLEGSEEYAVYGWFKFARGETVGPNTCLFNLKDQSNDSDDSNWGITVRVGDKALSGEYSQTSESLRFHSYNTSPTA